jgi:hypothetical protein
MEKVGCQPPYWQSQRGAPPCTSAEQLAMLGEQIKETREMENISRGLEVPAAGYFVTIRTEASIQDVTVARLQSTRLQTPLSPPPPFKCNVLRESLSVDSQINSCASLKRRCRG